jgi:hypothetical protein
MLALTIDMRALKWVSGEMNDMTHMGAERNERDDSQARFERDGRDGSQAGTEIEETALKRAWREIGGSGSQVGLEGWG